ncbi:MAG TPA: TrmH family RNA methyltransferase [Candidatus Dormibacteraeota bacterium]|nr:TrmH family RNA methyltransferase [Candidatus Dormibacteraeota bacterium]
MAAPVVIESAANPRLRAALALRERREREATGRTLVDGARESLRAIEAGAEIVEAFVCRPMLESEEARLALERIDRLPERHRIEVSQRAFARLAYGDRADGVVLVVTTPPTRLEDLKLPANPLVVVTEDVEKPGNVGAILRSADAVGASAVIAAGGTDLFNPNVIRASIGTIFKVPVATGSAREVIDWLLGAGIRVVASRVDAATLHVDADLTGAVAVVLGSEAEGLSEMWRSPAVEGIRLPMLGAADSLNVSAAAAVLLYEAWRQRRAAAESS